MLISECPYQPSRKQKHELQHTNAAWCIQTLSVQQQTPLWILGNAHAEGELPSQRTVAYPDLEASCTPSRDCSLPCKVQFQDITTRQPQSEVKPMIYYIPGIKNHILRTCGNNCNQVEQVSQSPFPREQKIHLICLSSDNRRSQSERVWE